MSAQFAGVCLPLGLPERPAIPVSSPSCSLVSSPRAAPPYTRVLFPPSLLLPLSHPPLPFPSFCFPTCVLREMYAVHLSLGEFGFDWPRTGALVRDTPVSTVRTACRWWQSVCVSRKISVNRFTLKCIACLFVTGLDLISRLIIKGTFPFREIPRNKLCRGI